MDIGYIRRWGRYGVMLRGIMCGGGMPYKVIYP